MKKFMSLIGAITLCVVLTLSLSSCGDGVDVAEISSETSSKTTPVVSQLKSPEDIFNIFTSNEMKGRLAGTDENQKAGELLADYFKGVGLEPYQSSESYYHEYKGNTYTARNSETTAIELQINGEKKSLDFGKDYLVSNTLADINISSMKITDDKDIESPKDYIYLADDFGDMQDNGESFYACALVGDINYHPTNSVESKFRITLSKATYDEIKQNIEDVKINITVSANIKETSLNNVVGKITGQQSNRALVISAHFDGVGYMGDRVSNSAIDNASGAATMLYVAENLAKRYAGAIKPTFDLYFVGFNSEENGLWGSKAFAEELSNQYTDIININLDCISGYDPLALGCVSSASDIVDEMRYEFENMGVEYNDIVYSASDHMSFEKQGYTAFTIGEMIDPLNKDVHTDTDTVDKVDISYCKKISNIVADYIYRKGGKIFEMKAQSEVVKLTPELSNQVNKKSIKKMDELKLKYNEYYQTIIDGVHVKMTGISDMKPEEFENSFSQVEMAKIPKELNGNKLVGILPKTRFITSKVALSDYSHEGVYDKVMSVDLSKESITEIELSYVGKDNNIIKVNIDGGGMRYKLGNVVKEEIVIDEITYRLPIWFDYDVGKEKKFYTFVFMHKEACFTVSYGSINADAIFGVDTKYTKEEMKGIIKTFDVTQFDEMLDIFE